MTGEDYAVCAIAAIGLGLVIWIIWMIGLILLDEWALRWRFRRDIFGGEGSWKWALKQLREGQIVMCESMSNAIRRKIINGLIMENRFHTVDEIYTAEEIEKQANTWKSITPQQAKKPPFPYWGCDWEIFKRLAVPKPDDGPSISPQEAEDIRATMLKRIGL